MVLRFPRLINHLKYYLRLLHKIKWAILCILCLDSMYESILLRNHGRLGHGLGAKNLIAVKPVSKYRSLAHQISPFELNRFRMFNLSQLAISLQDFNKKNFYEF